MQVSDGIAIGAALISLVSLYVAWRAYGQTGRIKGTELRTELLLLIVDMIFKIGRCQQVASEVLAHSDSTQDLEMYKLASAMVEKLNWVSARISAEQRSLERVTPADAIVVYASQRHKLEELSKQLGKVHDEVLDLGGKLKKAQAQNS